MHIIIIKSVEGAVFPEGGGVEGGIFLEGGIFQEGGGVEDGFFWEGRYFSRGR